MHTHARLLLAVIWLFTAIKVFAYDLAYHEDISHRALLQLNFTGDARRLVSNYNMAVDIKVNTAGLILDYLRKEHYDDRFRFSEHKALRDLMLADLSRLGRLDCSDDDDLYTFAAAVGLMHHAFQDFYVHSNHTEVTSLTLDGRGLPYSFPTFDDVLQPAQGLDGLKAAWLADVERDVAEALISGAYFTSPPDILDPNGDPKLLHHDILNKDKAAGAGDYLYASRANRALMHQRSTRVATREMLVLDQKLRAVNGGCRDTLREYEFGILEQAWQTTKRLLLKAAGSTFGHWRSGSFVFEGDELRITITVPSVYPDSPPATKKTWTYEVENLGLEPIRLLRVSGDTPLQAGEVPAVQGWNAARRGDDLEWTASPGDEIAPGAKQTFEVLPARNAVPGYVQMTTDTGHHASQLVGPVTPDWFDASFLRAAALLADLDEKEVLDDAGIPPSSRDPPFVPRDGKASKGYSTVLFWGALIVVAVVAFAAGRRRTVR